VIIPIFAAVLLFILAVLFWMIVKIEALHECLKEVKDELNAREK
jgi:hypothetical protein